jgi:hypothetical protein
MCSESSSAKGRNRIYLIREFREGIRLVLLFSFSFGLAYQQQEVLPLLFNTVSYM